MNVKTTGRVCSVVSSAYDLTDKTTGEKKAGTSHRLWLVQENERPSEFKLDHEQAVNLADLPFGCEVEVTFRPTAFANDRGQAVQTFNVLSWRRLDHPAEGNGARTPAAAGAKS